MSLFRKKKEETYKSYWAASWDQRLYEALFPQDRESLMDTRIFRCLLTKRNSKITSNLSLKPIHTYSGIYKFWVSKTEYCDIPLKVTFEDSDDYYYKFINEYAVGCSSFCQTFLRGHQHAAMNVYVRNEDGIADHVAKLFAEIKTSGGNGIEFCWTAILTGMAGLSAEQVWGDWKESPTYNDDGWIDANTPIGRITFALQNFSFQAEL